MGYLHLFVLCLVSVALPLSAQESPPLPTAEGPQPVNQEPSSERFELTEVVAQGSALPVRESAPDPEEPALPKAKSVDLGDPVVEEELLPTPIPEDDGLGIVIDDQSVPETDVLPDPFVLLNTAVGPGTSTRLLWSPSKSFEGIATPTPILIVNGMKPGPTLCLTAAIHGDELNGIEITRRVLYDIDAEKLSGTIIGVPIVNLQGFHRGSRYLTDRRDLNRFFPGNTTGSSAARIAYSFFHEVITHCDALVDLHTGSFYRSNLPQLRADTSKESVVDITRGFGATVILHSEGAPGTLRRAAVDAGIPAVTLEAGEPMRLDEEAVAHGVKGIRTLLNQMGMLSRVSFWGDPEPVYHHSVWVRANQGGILFTQVELGQRVEQDELMGTVTDPITNIRSDVHSPYNGRVIGMALNQVVMPGFAAFHIAIRPEDAVLDEPLEGEAAGLDDDLQEDIESALPMEEDDLEVN